MSFLNKNGLDTFLGLFNTKLKISESKSALAESEELRKQFLEEVDYDKDLAFAKSDIVLIDAPTLNFNDNILSWNLVDYADTYNIYVDGELKYSNTNYSSLDIAELELIEAWKYTITVTAASQADSGAVYESDPSNEILYEVPISLRLDGSVLSWNPIKNIRASWNYVAAKGDPNDYFGGYTGFINTNTNNTTFDLKDANRIEKGLFGRGPYTIFISACVNYNDQFYELPCNTVSYTFDEAIPFEAPVLSIEDSVISWTPVEYADRYLVSINGSQYQSTSTTHDLLADNYVTRAGHHHITVRAVRNRLSYSEPSNEVTYEIPPPPVPVLSIDGSILSWTTNPYYGLCHVRCNELPNANEIVHASMTEPNNIDLNELSLLPGTYTFKARASYYYYSPDIVILLTEYSNEVTYVVPEST